MEEKFDVFDCLFEENLDLVLDGPLKRRRIHWRVDHVALRYENEHSCLHKDTATEVLHELKPHLISNRTNKNHAFPPNNHKSKFLLFVNRYDKSFLIIVKNSFCCFTYSLHYTKVIVPLHFGLN